MPFICNSGLTGHVWQVVLCENELNDGTLLAKLGSALPNLRRLDVNAASLLPTVDFVIRSGGII